MNADHEADDPSATLTREEMMSAIFANMVVQQTNMALMLMGKVPHPESGETVHDVEAAQMFIDQLEMLEVKTKGNLDRHEEGLLKQSLMTLRMAFVEAVEKGGPQPPSPTPSTPPSSGQAAAPAQPAAKESAAEAEAESRKKFSKKY